MPRILLRIQYIGANYAGWQIQSGIKTVQGELEQALLTIYKKPVELKGASRTDSGVHALGQVAVYDAPAVIPLPRLTRSLNALSAYDINILAAQEVSSDFNPRKNKGKRYFYKIISATSPNICHLNSSWFINQKLDLKKMRAAAKLIQAVSDFKAFRDKNCQALSTIKKITKIDIQDPANYYKPVFDGKKSFGLNNNPIIIVVEGNSFLKQMVRIIVGTLVDVGKNKITIAELKKAINIGERKNLGQTAPARGLVLDEIFY